MLLPTANGLANTSCETMPIVDIITRLAESSWFHRAVSGLGEHQSEMCGIAALQARTPSQTTPNWD
jgi:hypothetical protein